MASKLIVTHLSHDLAAKKSDLSFVWSNDPAKRLGLEVPYGTDLSDVEAAGRQALAPWRANSTIASCRSPTAPSRLRACLPKVGTGFGTKTCVKTKT